MPAKVTAEDVTTKYESPDKDCGYSLSCMIIDRYWDCNYTAHQGLQQLKENDKSLVLSNGATKQISTCYGAMGMIRILRLDRHNPDTMTKINRAVAECLQARQDYKQLVKSEI